MFSRKGFTILELLIVIAVIAILVGIALPRFRGMQDEGNIARAKGELRMLQTAVESFYIHNDNTLPDTLAELSDAKPQIAPAVIPGDPFGTDYMLVPGDDGEYIIYSAGPGGDGAASFVDGEVTDTNNCIYVTNASPVDTKP